MQNLSEKVLVVNLNIRRWSGLKYDETVTKQVDRDHNATNAGRYTKILIEKAEFKRIQKAESAIRSYYYEQTLIWSDNGDRILPSENYFRFHKELTPLKAEFNNAVKEFVSRYLRLKACGRTLLNGMFREEDYPPLSEIAEKFGIKMTMLPMPKTDDFRLKVNEEEVIHLRQKMEEDITAMVNEANKSLYLRIQEVLQRMVQKLSDADAVFRDSLVSNVDELANLIPRLNFTEDRRLDKLVQAMKPLIIDPDTLRNSPGIRNQKADEAQQLLDKVNDFLG